MCDDAVVSKIESIAKAKSRSRSELINLMLVAVIDDAMFMRVALREVNHHGES
jgi:hypothetical protein